MLASNLEVIMLHWFRTLDSDQQATVVSSGIIIFIAVLAAMLLPMKMMLLIFPLQFLITYFLFCSKQVSCSEHWCVDKKSHKRWLLSTCDLFPNIGMTLNMLFGAIAVGNPSKFVAFIAILCPLLITRAIIFVRKLPLIALYADLLLKH